MTVGGSEAIDLAIRAIVNPGDEVLIVEPSFVCYKPIVELMHGMAIPISTQLKNKFKLTAEELRSHITERTKLLILPYPNNPTGGIMTREDLEAIAEVLRDTNDRVFYDCTGKPPATIDDYLLHTPKDPLRSPDCVRQRCLYGSWKK